MDEILATILIFLTLINMIIAYLSFCMLHKVRQFFVETNKDFVDAMSAVMKINTNGFKDTFEALNSMQKWNEKCFEKNIEVQNSNAQKIYENLFRQQNFMGKMAEQLGYRPRTDLEV